MSKKTWTRKWCLFNISDFKMLNIDQKNIVSIRLSEDSLRRMAFGQNQ